MNTKKLLVAVLGIASTATWGPQVWDQVQGRSEPEVVYPEADEAGMATSVVSPGVAPVQEPVHKPALAAVKPEARTAPAAQPASLDAPQGVVRGESASGQLGELLGVLETFAGGRSSELSDLLDQRPSWLEEPEEASAEPVANSGVQSLEAARSSAQDKEHSQAARIESFLKDSPLTAIVCSKSGAWAMLGGRIVRSGDVLLPKLLKVASISTRHVTLSSPTGEISVPLPAFQASSPSAPTTPESELATPESPLPAEASTLPALDPS